MSCFGLRKKAATNAAPAAAQAAQQPEMEPQMEVDSDLESWEDISPSANANANANACLFGFGLPSWGGRAPRVDRGNGPHKLFTQDEKLEDKLVAVVVTISTDASYDEMFRQVQPVTVTGERVSTYSLDCREVEELRQYMAAEKSVPEGTPWQSLLDELRQVEADSVTFNWECCAGCSDSGFPLVSMMGVSRPRAQRGRWQGRSAAGASPTMQLMGLVIRRGHTVMCSDFSLKALIAEWSEEHLGPNPFVKTGECDQGFELAFLPADLQGNDEVPQQLQVVGELCADQGKACVAAMVGTILYTVNPRRAPTDLYQLKVLTVVTKDAHGQVAAMPDAMRCSVGAGDAEKRGAAGHTSLTYASGGQLITSTGHWIELTRINTTAEALLSVARHNFGAAESDLIETELRAEATEMGRQEVVQKWARNHVQKSVPTRMMHRTKY